MNAPAQTNTKIPGAQRSELSRALWALRPRIVRAAFLSIIAGMLAFSYTGYMLEVYDRVVNSRNHNTLLMLTILVVGAYGMTSETLVEQLKKRQLLMRAHGSDICIVERAGRLIMERSAA